MADFHAGLYSCMGLLGHRGSQRHLPLVPPRGPHGLHGAARTSGVATSSGRSCTGTNPGCMGLLGHRGSQRSAGPNGSHRAPGLHGAARTSGVATTARGSGITWLHGAARTSGGAQHLQVRPGLPESAGRTGLLGDRGPHNRSGVAAPAPDPVVARACSDIGSRNASARRCCAAWRRRSQGPLRHRA